MKTGEVIFNSYKRRERPSEEKKGTMLNNLKSFFQQKIL